MQSEDHKGVGLVLGSLRQVTRELHDRIEQRFNAIVALSDPSSRRTIIDRYATLYRTAHGRLAGELDGVDGLDFDQRSKAWSNTRLQQAPADTTSVFPDPADTCEALGIFYVVEGSTLGGRHILRQLRAQGIEDAELNFLDPYGTDSGSMWRSLIAVLEREGSRGPTHLESICRGAARGFAFAEHVLCGDASEFA